MKPKPFAVPAELLTQFKQDVRVIPQVLHPNGWIIFDRAMLVSVLRSNNEEARIKLANSLDKLGKTGGELMIVGP